MMGAKYIALTCLILIIISASCRMESPPERVWRFLAVGDTGTGTGDQRNVANSMKVLIDHEGADFVLLLGDNFYPTGVDSVQDPQWKSKFEDVYGYWGLPVMAVMGNHDYGGNGAGNEDFKATFETTYTRLSRTWYMPSTAWSLARGPAILVALDTNWLKNHLDDSLGQGLLVQAAFAQLHPWRIAFGHHPYLSNGPHGNAGAWDNGGSDPVVNGKNFKDFFELHLLDQADLYLSGHDHDLQMLPPPNLSERPILVVAGGGGAGLTSLSSQNVTLFQQSTFGFAAVDYTSYQLHIRLFDGAGTLLYQKSLSKP